MIGVDRQRNAVRSERRAHGREIAREPHRDFAFDADADEIAVAQADAAGMNALREHPAAAGMRDADILLHHRTGAADLVAGRRPYIRRQQIVNRILNAVALGFILRGDIRGQRLQRPAVAAGGSDGLCGFERFVHREKLSRFPSETVGPHLLLSCARHEGPDDTRICDG